MPTADLELLTREDILAILKISPGTLDKYLENKIIPGGRAWPTGRQLYWRSDEFWEAVNQILPYRPAAGSEGTPQASSPARAALGSTPPATTDHGQAAVRSPPITRGSAAERARRRATAQLVRLNSG
jgi:hypothetical protein